MAAQVNDIFGGNSALKARAAVKTFSGCAASRDDTMSRLECSRIGRISAVRPKIPKRPFELPSRKTCLSVIGCWRASEQKFCIRATEGQKLVKKTNFRPMGRYKEPGSVNGSKSVYVCLIL